MYYSERMGKKKYQQLVNSWHGAPPTDPHAPKEKKRKTRETFRLFEHPWPY